MKDENAVVRVRAAYALKALGVAADAAIPALIDALQDEDEWVGIAAAVTLATIDRTAAVAVATEQAEDRHLSPKVIDVLLHYDDVKVMEVKKHAM